MATPDGSVVIEVNMNVSDAEKELARLKKRAFKLEDEIGEKVFKRGPLSSELLKARKELKKLQNEKPAALVDGKFADNSEYEKELQAATEKVDGLAEALKKVDEEIDAQNLSLEWTKQRYGEIVEAANELKTGFAAQNAAEEMFSGMADKAAETVSWIKRLREQLDGLEAHKASLGLALGARDEYRAVSAEIESVQKQLDKMTAELDEMARSGGLGALANGSDIAEQRIKELSEELEDLQQQKTNLGLAFGAKDQFEGLSDEIERVSDLISAYERNLSEEAVLRKMAEDAEISNQHIVDLNRELLELKKKQAALEKSGVGLGYQEYEQNAARITEIKKELKEYQDSLGKTGAAAEKMNGILEKMISSMASSENAALKSIGTVAGSVVSKAAPALAAAAEVGSVVKSFAGKVSASLKSILSGFGKASAAVLKFGITAAKAFSRAAMGALAFLKKVNVFPKMFSSIGKSFKRLGSIVKSALIFSVIYQGLALVRTQMAAYLRVNTEFSTALRRLQGALLTAFQPIYEVVVPALTSLINVLTRAIATVTQFFAALFGKTAKQAQANAKDLYEQAKATTAAGNAAEEASKQMASFDEINQLRENKSGGGGGSGASAETGPLFDYDYEDTPFNSWGEAFSAFLDKLLAGIPELEKSLMGFVDRLNDLAEKLYEMFTFPGVLDKVKQLGEDLADMMNRITDAIEWELIGRALGAGLNLALNFLTSFIYRYDWMNLGRHLAEFINGLVDEIDWYEFGRLLWSGFKIGLETLAGFILGLNMPEMGQAASKIIMGFFDEMKNTIERIPWSQIGSQIAEFLNNIDWYVVLSRAIKAFQAALFAMQQTISGFVKTLQWHEIAVSIYTAINDSLGKINWRLLGKTLGDLFIHIFDFVREVIAGINWRQIGEDISDFLTGIDWRGIADAVLGAIKEAFKASSGFFSGLIGEELKRTLTDMLITISKYTLVIGALLALSGANIPLGLGLMKVGAASLAAAAVLDWEYVSGQIQRIITTVTTVLGGALLAIGAILTFSGANIPLGIGLIALGAASLATAATVNWDFMPKTISGVITTALQFLSVAFLVLGAILTFSGANVPLGIGLIALGAVSLATAAAINWDILPNTIGGLVSKIAAILSVSLLVLGAILACSGVALPLGIALIAAGAAGLVTVGALNWDAILEKLRGVWKDIESWWNNDVKKYFTLEHWKGKGKEVLDGFLAGLKVAFTAIREWVNEKVQWIKDKFSGATDSYSGGYGGGVGRGSYYASQSLPDISTFNIPALAKGAVIPPNREFMAVLGDQKSGTNIETPLPLMIQAFKQALAESNLGGNGTHTTILQIDRRELGRVVYDVNNEETQRVGVKLAGVRR